MPGGTYSRRKLVNWTEKMPEIGSTFRGMSEESERDPSRPSIEFYRSQEELVLFLPVK